MIILRRNNIKGLYVGKGPSVINVLGTSVNLPFSRLPKHNLNILTIFKLSLFLGNKYIKFDLLCRIDMAPVLERFVSDSNINRLNFLIEKYGSAGVFIAAISPIPYKALAWIAGAGKMDLRLFAIAGIFGRGIRFGSVGLLLGVYGESVQSSLNWLNFTLISIFCLVLLIPIVNWWKSIGSEA